MEILILIGLIVVGVVVWRSRQNLLKAQPPKTAPVEPLKPKLVTPKPDSKPSDVSSRIAETPAVETVAPAEDPKVSDVTESQAPAAEPLVESKASEVIEKPAPVVAPASQPVVQEDKVPEDSTLRRHYLSTRWAEKEAIIHPYPTDASLRRHHESGLAMALKESVLEASIECSAQTPNTPNSKVQIPEDSALRRHFLTQVQAEIESQLLPRPTDSVLRRHYDGQVKAKMEEYLAKEAA